MARARSETTGLLTLRQLNRATLARQLLLTREKLSAPKATERLCGLQAQWPKPPFVGVWTRCSGFAAEELLGALRAGKLVRATFFRGTLHVVSAADYLAFRELLQPMLTRGALAILRQRAKGLDVTALVEKARQLLGHDAKSFEQIRDHLAAGQTAVDARAMGYLVRMGLPLVQVPSADGWGFPVAPDFMLAEAWLDKPLKMPADAAQRLVKRYLSAFGPASVSDYQIWSGLQAQKPVFESLAGELCTFRDERKRELFDLRKAPRPPADEPAPPRFLPEFDNVLLAHADRSRIVASADKKRVFLPGLRVAPTFLIDGLVAGTWKLARKGKTAILSATPFRKLDKQAASALALEAYPLAAFLEPDADAHEFELARA